MSYNVTMKNIYPFSVPSRKYISTVAILSAVTLFILTLSACAELEGLAGTPTARIDSVDITSVDFESASFLINVKVDNPNPLGLNLSAYDYGLDAWQSTIVEGRQEKSVSLKASGVSDLPIPVSIAFDDLLTVGTSVLTEDSAPLDIRLGLEMAIPYMSTIRLDLEAFLELPIPKPPIIIPTGIKVNRINLTGASIRLDMNVKNPNIVPITINSLGGKLAVSGNDWGGIGISEKIALDAGSEKNIAVSMDISFGAVGRSAWSLLSGSGSTDVDLDGDMDIDMDFPGFNGSGIPWDADARVSVVR